jgi:hypothetical protein
MPFEVFDCNGATCPAFRGPIRHELEQAGQAIGAMDLLIAARALALVATLVTKTPCPFRRISGLSVMRLSAGTSTRAPAAIRAAVRLSLATRMAATLAVAPMGVAGFESVTPTV